MSSSLKNISLIKWLTYFDGGNFDVNCHASGIVWFFFIAGTILVIG